MRIPGQLRDEKMGDEAMERTLLKDKEWDSIDGQLCLVKAFAPMAKVENGSVVAIPGTPYASVRLRCEKSAGDITGFITHRIDFLMLWTAFNQRTAVPGTRVEARSSEELNPSGLGENEEVWLVWSRKNYRGAGRLFNTFLPRLVVMVSRKGAFELVLDRTGQVRPELKGEARALATLPVATWTPEVMKE
ncbi:MAG: hypothetical protein AAB393_02290 [Bacteroidota bacterium]